MPRPAQPWLIRATHWANVFLFAVMAGSGLRILIAYPFLGPRGELYGWYPFQGAPPPGALTIGVWLAGARHWHFAFAWLFVANALVYFTYLFASGEWRRRLFFPRRDARNAWETVLHDLRLRKDAPPPVGLYNGMQRLAYTAVLATAPLIVLSGPRHVQAGAAAAPHGAGRRLRRRPRHPPARARGARAVHGRPRHPGAPAPADARRHDQRPARRRPEETRA